jgi:hypothetical protein
MRVKSPFDTEQCLHTLILCLQSHEFSNAASPGENSRVILTVMNGNVLKYMVVFTVRRSISNALASRFIVSIIEIQRKRYGLVYNVVLPLDILQTFRTLSRRASVKKRPCSLPHCMVTTTKAPRRSFMRCCPCYHMPAYHPRLSSSG